MGSIPGSGRSPGGGHGKTFQYSCLENPKDRGAWQASLVGHTESDTTEATEQVCKTVSEGEASCRATQLSTWKSSDCHPGLPALETTVPPFLPHCLPGEVLCVLSLFMPNRCSLCEVISLSHTLEPLLLGDDPRSHNLT